MSEKFNEGGYSRLADSALGCVIGILVMSVIFAVSRANADKGRGAEITACAKEYTGIIRVTDLNVLDNLAQVADKRNIGDSEATYPKIDKANLPGELACLQSASNGIAFTVLTASGLDVLQYNEILDGILLDGLEWNYTAPATTTSSVPSVN